MKKRNRFNIKCLNKEKKENEKEKEESKIERK